MHFVYRVSRSMKTIGDIKPISELMSIGLQLIVKSNKIEPLILSVVTASNKSDSN